MPTRLSQTPTREPTPRRGALVLMLAGATALLLAGCKYEFANVGCKKVKSDEVHVASGQTCKFKYDEGDIARYVVVVTKPPAHGQATGEGKYLKYAAKPGFVGKDRLTIRVERRGVGHVQWQMRTVKVTVGPAA